MHVSRLFSRMLKVYEQVDEPVKAGLNVVMCWSLDNWDANLKRWDAMKTMNCNKEVKVTVQNMRNFLNFSPEVSYTKRWLTMDAIVAYARLFETLTVKIITPYPIQTYVKKGNTMRGWTIKAKSLSNNKNVLIPLLDSNGRHWMMLDVMPKGSTLVGM